MKREPLNPDRLPPHSLEAEQAVLGSVLLGLNPQDAPAAMAEVCQVFRGARPETFYDLRHQLIFSALIDLQADSKPIDMIMLCQKLADRKQLADVGGPGYLATLPDRVASSLEAKHYAEIVHQKACLRATLRACLAFIRAIDENEEDGDAACAALELAVVGASADRVGSTEKTMRDLIPECMRQFDNYKRGGAQLRGLPTGFAYLDKLLSGMAPGQMITIAARPGMGKTSLGMNIVEHLAVDRGVSCGVISCEMLAEDLVMRAIFQRTGGDMQRFRTGYFEVSDLPAVGDAMNELIKAKIVFEDRSGMTIEEIRSIARRWVFVYGIQFLLVDYIQLVETAADFMSREQAVAYVSRQCKAMAKELKIPVMVLGQFNRELEKRKGGQPQMSDLRESGAIEQDSDVVGLLYAVDDDVIAASKMTPAEVDWSRKYRRVNLKIAKQRMGPTGIVTLVFEKSCMRFASLNANTGDITDRRAPTVFNRPASDSLIPEVDVPTSPEDKP